MASSAQAGERTQRFDRLVEQHEVVIQRALCAALGPAEGRAASVGAFSWAYANLDAIDGSPNPRARLYEAGLHSVARGDREFHADGLTTSPAMRETLAGLDRDRRVALILSVGHRYDDAIVGSVLDVDRDQLRVLLLGANDALRRGLHVPVGGDPVDPQVAAVARELDRLTQPIDPDESVVRGATDELTAADRRAFMLVIGTALLVVVLGLLWVVFVADDENVRVELTPREDSEGEGDDPLDTEQVEFFVRDGAIPAQGVGVVLGTDVILYDLDGDVVARAPEADDAAPPAPGYAGRVSTAGGVSVLAFDEPSATRADRLADDCVLPFISPSGVRASPCGPPDAFDRVAVQRVPGGPVTTLVGLPPGDEPQGEPDGEWAYVIVAPDGEQALLQWVDPCPTAFVAPTAGGALVTATGEAGVAWPQAQASRWVGFTADGEPVVQLDDEPACGAAATEPGLYRLAEGGLEPVAELPDPPLFTFVWTRV